MERDKDISTRIDTEVTRDFEQMHTQPGSLLSNCADEVIHADEQRSNWPTDFFDLYGCAKDDDSFARPSQGDPSLDDLSQIDTEMRRLILRGRANYENKNYVVGIDAAREQAQNLH